MKGNILILFNCLTNKTYGFLDAAFLLLNSENLVLRANVFSRLSVALATWSAVGRLPFKAYFWFLKNFWQTCKINNNKLLHKFQKVYIISTYTTAWFMSEFLCLFNTITMVLTIYKKKNDFIFQTFKKKL